VKSEWIHEGTHINAIGADAPGNEELDQKILKQSTVFVDDPVQAVHYGEINIPIATEHLHGWRLQELLEKGLLE